MCTDGEKNSNNGNNKKTKKKFRMRHNQTTPYAETPMTSDDLEQIESSYVDTPRRPLPQLKLTRSPQLDRLREDNHDEEDGLSVCQRFENANKN